MGRAYVEANRRDAAANADDTRNADDDEREDGAGEWKSAAWWGISKPQPRQ